MINDTDTVDITEAAKALQSAWITFSTSYVTSAAITVPWLAWLALPVINPLFHFMINRIITSLSKAVEMQGFFLNTALRKASQASDFVAAVNAVQSAPIDMDMVNYEKLEQAQMSAFSNFVKFTN